jgi:hypothetical protein
VSLAFALQLACRAFARAPRPGSAPLLSCREMSGGDAQALYDRMQATIELLRSTQEFLIKAGQARHRGYRAVARRPADASPGAALPGALSLNAHPRRFLGTQGSTARQARVW